MSGFVNNFTQRRSQGFWGPEDSSGAQGGVFNSYSSRVVRQLIYRNSSNDVFHGSRSVREPWELTEGRVMVGPLNGFSSFLLPMLDEVMARDTNSTPIHSIPSPYLELMRHEVDDTNRTLDEQNKALKTMRKEIYNPALKRLSKRVSHYYKNGNSKSSSNNVKAKQEDDDEEKSCVICLDDFEAKQVVIVTPCEHMFHENCILPWVKSHGRCPVCRSHVSDQMRM